MVILLDKVEIIKHCRKTLLYYEDSIWIKKKGRVEISTFRLGHMMAQKFASSSGVYYCIVLIRL